MSFFYKGGVKEITIRRPINRGPESSPLLYPYDPPLHRVSVPSPHFWFPWFRLCTSPTPDSQWISPVLSRSG